MVEQQQLDDLLRLSGLSTRLLRMDPTAELSEIAGHCFETLTTNTKSNFGVLLERRLQACGSTKSLDPIVDRCVVAWSVSKEGFGEVTREVL